MKKADVKAVLGRVLTWPAEVQKEAVSALRAIEQDRFDDYLAIPEELAEIGEVDREELATDGKVESAVGTFRSARASKPELV